MDADKNNAAKREETTLAFWNERKIFEKSLANEAPKGEYVFYDGPPFATGTPRYVGMMNYTSFSYETVI